MTQRQSQEEKQLLYRKIARSIACDAGAQISYLSDFAPGNFSKIRKPKNPAGMKFPRDFCRFKEISDLFEA